MSYRLLVLPRALKEIASLPRDAAGRVTESIRSLAETPYPRGCAKLSGREGWRLRVGRYRVLYDVDEKNKTLTVVHVGHRKDVYR